MSSRRIMFVTLSTIALLCGAVVESRAQRPVLCGCYCGRTTAPPCSEAACKAICGYVAPSQGGVIPPSGGGNYSTPSPDYEAVFRARQEEERQRVESEQLEAERRKADEERAFIEQRDAAAKSLKGVAPGANTATFGIRGAMPASDELRVPGALVNRDVGGYQIGRAHV